MWTWPDIPQWQALREQVAPALQRGMALLADQVGRSMEPVGGIVPGASDGPLWTLDGDTLCLHPSLVAPGVHWSGHQEHPRQLQYPQHQNHQGA